MAALGLGTGLIWDASAVVYPPIVNPYDLYQMLLWWDFTDKTQLFQEVDSFTTMVSLDEDPIGRVKNKALIAQPQFPWLDDVDKLGLFGRALVDAKRPVHKTGGANGYTYALFKNSANTALISKQDAAYGVHSGTVLTETKLSSNQWTLITVAQAADNDTDGTDEYFMGIEMTHNVDNDKRIRLSFQREDDLGAGGADDKFWMRAFSTDDAFSSETPTNTIFSNSTNSEMSPELEVRIISANSDVPFAPSSLSVAQRGLNSISGLPGGYDVLNASEGVTRAYSFEESTNNASFIVGNDYTLNSNYHFDGKIYEVLLFKGGIDISTANGIAWYFKNKYGMDIQGANE